MGCIDPEFFESLDRCWPEQIASHSRHHEHICATKPGSNCLIRALPAEPEVELLTKYRFPWFRKLVCESCQVDVGTSNHCDARAPGHNFRGKLENAEFIGPFSLCQRRMRQLMWRQCPRPPNRSRLESLPPGRTQPRPGCVTPTF